MSIPRARRFARQKDSRLSRRPTPMPPAVPDYCGALVVKLRLVPFPRNFSDRHAGMLNPRTHHGSFPLFLFLFFPFLPPALASPRPRILARGNCSSNCSCNSSSSSSSPPRLFNPGETGESTGGRNDRGPAID